MTANYKFVELAADADCAEAENYVAARNFAAETGHRMEAREQQHLVKFVLHFAGIGASENLIADHFAVRTNGDIEHQAVWKR